MENCRAGAGPVFAGPANCIGPPSLAVGGVCQPLQSPGLKSSGDFRLWQGLRRGLKMPVRRLARLCRQSHPAAPCSAFPCRSLLPVSPCEPLFHCKALSFKRLMLIHYHKICLSCISQTVEKPLGGIGGPQLSDFHYETGGMYVGFGCLAVQGSLFAARRAGKERFSSQKIAVWRAFVTARDMPVVHFLASFIMLFLAAQAASW